MAERIPYPDWQSLYSSPIWLRYLMPFEKQFDLMVARRHINDPSVKGDWVRTKKEGQEDIATELARAEFIKVKIKNIGTYFDPDSTVVKPEPHVDKFEWGAWSMGDFIAAMKVSPQTILEIANSNPYEGGFQLLADASGKDVKTYNLFKDETPVAEYSHNERPFSSK